ncbi:MAG: eukaryotic-like serine/threonine-protein kinase [Verrucomicrobiota bacterium]|jgi:TolB-like protein/DNA-binding winged helix-turn-helix (wHTH) protein/Tfp pilus assembly protein PilF
METTPVQLYEFGDFRVDPAKRLLRRRDGTPVPLTPRVFDTLLFLIEHPGAVLDKERLMEAVWPDSIVEENNLSQNISTLRRIFGETPGSHHFIVTVPGRGYRFVAEVTTSDPASEEVTPSPARRDDQLTTSATPTEAESKVIATAPERAPASLMRRIIIPLGAILALAGAFLLFRGYTKRSAPPTVQTVADSISPKSIAVLPFENLSGDAENAYFTAGVQDEILSDLAKIADLKVISRTSSNLYKTGSPRNAREIGQQLGVAHLLEGSVQRVGQRVRVNAQLVDARTDAHLWANSYDRDLADVFAMQSEIAQTIADQLQARISPAEKAVIEERPTANMAAFDAYTRGAALINNAGINRTGKEDLLRGILLVESATASDPNFFLAYCKLADAHDRLYRAGLEHTPERLAAADAAVRAAARLRPDSGETHFALAVHLHTQDLNDAARQEVAIARRTLPNDGRCFSLISNIDQKEGRWTEYVDNLRRALDYDPRNADLLNQISWGYEWLRDYRGEAAAIDKILSFQPDNMEAAIHRGQVDISWRADTRRLRQVIDTQAARNPAVTRKLAPICAYLALCERNATAATQAANDMGDDNTFGPGVIRFSGQFTKGLIARMQGDSASAREAFTAARLTQEKLVGPQSDYAPALCVLGLIDAALDRKDEALREGRRAAELMPVEKNTIDGSLILDFLAIIYAWTGEKDLAIEQIRKTIHLPGLSGYGQFKLLPFWDPLRGDPRFEELVASLAPK